MRVLIRYLSACALIVGAATTAMAQAPQGYPENYGTIIDAAKKEATLRIYSTTDAGAAQALVKDFEALYPGIAIEYSDISSAELYSRVISEKAAGQPSADFVWTSGMDTGMRLAADGYASEYASPEIAAIPAWAVWENKAYGTTSEPLVFLYNKRLLPADSVPQSHDDLARLATEKPDLFQGKITTYDPSRTLGLMLNVFDAEYNPKFWDMLKSLGKAGMKIDASSGTMMEKVGSGEYLLAWNVIGSYVPPLMARNPSVDMVIPKDYTLVLSRIAFVADGAEHPNAAKLFLDYLLSARGQTVLAEGAGLYSLRDDVDVKHSVAKLREAVGDVLKPIPIGQPMLDKVMQEENRVKFLKDFSAALAGQ